MSTTDKFIIGSEISSNHGTSQGIIPRFLLQMNEMASLTFEKEIVVEKFDSFTKKIFLILLIFMICFSLLENYIWNILKA